MLHVHVFHEVAEGDTMLSIALEFQLNFATLMKLNPQFVEQHRDINRIYVGELIRIQ